VQDTWVAAFERPPRHGGALAAWLSKILRREASSRGRREGERSDREALAARDDLQTEGVEPASIAFEIELQRHVFECVERLREPYQSTIYLRYYRGLLPAAIAARERVPVKTVKTRLSRGLELLREALDRRHGGREAWMAVLLPLARAAPLPISAGRIPWSAGWRVPVTVGLCGLGLVLAGGAAFLAHHAKASTPAERVSRDRAAADQTPERAPGERVTAASERTPLRSTAPIVVAAPAPGRLSGRVVIERLVHTRLDTLPRQRLLVFLA